MKTVQNKKFFFIKIQKKQHKNFACVTDEHCGKYNYK